MKVEAGACFIGFKNSKKQNFPEINRKYIQEYAHKVLEANSKYLRRYKAERSGRSGKCARLAVARLFLSNTLKLFFGFLFLRFSKCCVQDKKN